MVDAVCKYSYETPERTEAEWKAEIKRRMEAYDCGEDKGVPREEVRVKMEARLNARKTSKGRQASSSLS
jgi:putative addiction module component (TIGR02574 family)